MAAKKKRTPNTHNDSWVVIAADSVVETQKQDCDADFVKLRNPATDEASLYMLGAGDAQLYEVKAFEEDFHSWFVGQTVQRDGKLLFITQMDPLYLILPYMIKCGQEEKFQPVNQVVKDDEFPESSRLLSCTRSLTSLHHIAEEKEDYLRYAHGLISEYISGELSKALLKHLRLPELKSAKETEPPSKKRKLSDKPVEAGEDYTKFNSGDFARKPPKKMTAAQKTLAKVDKSGMKPMSSFFSPKTKAEKK
ncbi:ribonuclease H2 subunit B isoform X3 [Poeciliopsis prolifica]|uniref:ribonuclease H2 subunit B isoform X3 n=1 Tax=Poeciliopsis prolifica TaxID=188132 RepID=UPI002413B8C3|nr:ribonuclease H2 subunit B isoform X3 [Poeciliopsis prolifica]